MLCSSRTSLRCVSSWLHVVLIRFQEKVSAIISEDNTTIRYINNYSYLSTFATCWGYLKMDGQTS